MEPPITGHDAISRDGRPHGLAGLAAVFTGTSVPWARLSDLTGIPALSRSNGRYRARWPSG